MSEAHVKRIAGSAAMTGIERLRPLHSRWRAAQEVLDAF
jgi:hypothetical protein